MDQPAVAREQHNRAGYLARSHTGGVALIQLHEPLGGEALAFGRRPGQWVLALTCDALRTLPCMLFWLMIQGYIPLRKL